MYLACFRSSIYCKFSVCACKILQDFTSGLRSCSKYSNTITNNVNITVGDCLKQWKKCFLQSGVSEPKESIEHILAHLLCSRKVTDVYKKHDMVLKPHDIERLQELCNKRLQHMPVQYIIQEWDFRDLTLKMSRPVFIPRPETEMLADIVLNEINTTYKPIQTFLEFCCGSGAISLTLLKSNPHLQGVALDKSLDACNLTKRNVEIHHMAHRLKIIHGQIEEINESFDLIVSNPPYVPTGDLENLQPEIKLFEDPDALDGGTDGLNIIKRILNVSSVVLKSGGKLFFEVDPSHPMLISTWLERNNNLKLHYLCSHKDFCDKERFVEIIKKNS